MWQYNLPPIEKNGKLYCPVHEEELIKINNWFNCCMPGCSYSVYRRLTKEVRNLEKL